MTHAMYAENDSDLYAEPTLTELIDNNEKILENRIQKETINKFVAMLTDHGKHKKNVSILRALVNCDGTAIVSNQAEISKLLLDDMDTRNRVIIPLRKERETI